VGERSGSIFEAHPRTQSLIYFWHKLGDLTVLRIILSGSGEIAAPFSLKWGLELRGYAKCLEDIEPSSALPQFVLEFRYVVSFWN